LNEDPTKKTPSLDEAHRKMINELLSDAIQSDNVARARLCFQKGAQPDIEVAMVKGDNLVPGSLLHFACTVWKYSPDMVRALVDNGVNINAKDHDGDTPLALAVVRRRKDMVEDLLSLGASPLNTNNAGQTILTLAKRLPDNEKAGREKIIDLLLQAIPDAKEQFNAGAAPPATTKAITAHPPLSFKAKPPEKGP
jgi:hypothetical protein